MLQSLSHAFSAYKDDQLDRSLSKLNLLTTNIGSIEATLCGHPEFELKFFTVLFEFTAILGNYFSKERNLGGSPECEEDPQLTIMVTDRVLEIILRISAVKNLLHCPNEIFRLGTEFLVIFLKFLMPHVKDLPLITKVR